MSSPHAVLLDGTRFWVTHRRKTYGPFDYEWSPDFCGVSLLYNGSRYGEYCSRDELFADLRPYRLPLTVVRVSSVVIGSILWGVMHGLSEAERRQLVVVRLNEFGMGRFAPPADEGAPTP